MTLTQCQMGSTDATNKILKSTSENNTITEANKFFSSKDYNKTIKLLEALPENKHNDQTLLLLGKAYLNIKNYKMAINSFNRCLEKIKSLENVNHKKKAQIHHLLGFSYQKNKDYELAIKHHNKNIEYTPKNPVPWSLIGYAYIDMKEFNKAQESLLKAHQLDNKYQSPITGLGRTYYALKEYDKSILFYKKLEKLNPSNPEAYLGQGNAYSKLNNTIKSHEMLARGYYLAKKIDLALENLNKINNIHQNKELLKLLIVCYMDKKDYSNAKKEIKTGINLFPNDDDFVFDLSQLYFREKKYQLALKTSLKAINKFPNSHILNVSVATAYQLLKNNNSAIDYFEKAIKIQEDDVETRNRLAQLYRIQEKKDLEYFHQGIVYFYTGDFTQSNAVLNWINKNFDRQSDLSYYKGMVLWGLKKNDESIKFLKQSIDFDKKNYLPYLALARAFKETDQKTKAVQILNKFLTNNPESKHTTKVKNTLNEL